MFGSIRGDRVLRRIAGRRSFPHILESCSKILGGDEAEERTVKCNGNFEGTF